MKEKIEKMGVSETAFLSAVKDLRDTANKNRDIDTHNLVEIKSGIASINTTLDFQEVQIGELRDDVKVLKVESDKNREKTSQIRHRVRCVEDAQKEFSLRTIAGWKKLSPYIILGILGLLGLLEKYGLDKIIEK